VEISMTLKKSQLNSSLWSGCDQPRGDMGVSTRRQSHEIDHV